MTLLLFSRWNGFRKYYSLPSHKHSNFWSLCLPFRFSFTVTYDRQQISLFIDVPRRTNPASKRFEYCLVPFCFRKWAWCQPYPPPSLPLWKKGGGYDYVHTLVATDERHWKKGRLICNFVIGSRPLSRGNVSNWNGARLLLSVSVRLCLSFAIRLPVSFIPFLVRFVLSISLSFCFMS